MVENFEYLDCTISQDWSLDHEVDRQIGKALQVFRSLYGVVWSRKRLSLQTKLRFFKAVVLATLLYDSESWVSLAAHLKCLQAFVMGCLRCFLGSQSETG